MPASGGATQPRLPDDYRALRRAAAARWSVGPVAVVSVSMGGVAGLDLASDGTVPGVVGWYGVSAVTDLTAARDRFAHSIYQVLTAEQVATLDPSQLPVSRWDGLRMATATATDDDRVPTAAQALPFAALVPQVQVRSCTGGHVSADCFDVEALTGMLR